MPGVDDPNRVQAPRQMVEQDDLVMKNISDETMRQLLTTSKEYCVVVLKAGPKRHEPGVDDIVYEHGRRNFMLRAGGQLAIVCRINDGSDLSGVGIFTTSVVETKKIMDEDPSVKAGVFVYELHLSRSFPGDSLP